MMPDNRMDVPESPNGDDVLPNRLTRGTLVGCLGILCVLAMPLLLFLPLESWGEPFWVQLLVPLLAFAAAALGAGLLARVPAGVQVRSSDPRYPLTGAGSLPVREVPATPPNRVAMGTAALLVACALFGVLLAMWSEAREPALVAGVLMAGVAGVLLALDGLLVAVQRAPTPAWRWVRLPVQSRRAPRGSPLALAGIATALWALLILAYAGLKIGAVGLALLLIAGVVAAPLARRIPRRAPARPSFPEDFAAGPLRDEE
jgi:hypothetical protein